MQAVALLNPTNVRMSELLGSGMRDIDVPGDGSCLYYAVCLSFLLPVLNDLIKFTEAYHVLFGAADSEAINELQVGLQKYDGTPEFITKSSVLLEVLVDTCFRRKVVSHMRKNDDRFLEIYNRHLCEESPELSKSQFHAYLSRQEEPKTWGGDPEILAMQELLKVRVQILRKSTAGYIIHLPASDGNEPLIQLVYTGAHTQENHYHFILADEFIPMKAVPGSVSVKVEDYLHRKSIKLSEVVSESAEGRNTRVVIGKSLRDGISNFSKLVSKNSRGEFEYTFVDKTMLIQSLIAPIGAKPKSEVSLIIKPRRFGKSINMSMIYNFLSSELVNGLASEILFDRLLIKERRPDLFEGSTRMQGQFPVIYINLAQVVGSSFTHSLEALYRIVAKLYDSYHERLTTGKVLSEYQKTEYSKFMTKTVCSEVELQNSLLFLSECLSAFTKKKVYILIDEYDAPVNHAFQEWKSSSSGDDQDPEKLISFYQQFFRMSFKENINLEQGLLTGITRIAQTSYASPFNNIHVYDVRDSEFSEYFGFMEYEVKELVKSKDCVSLLSDIQKWYNGYNFFKTDHEKVTIYNPNSIMCLLTSEYHILKSYWSTTGSDEWIKEVLIKYKTPSIVEGMKLLLEDHSISTSLSDKINFNSLLKNITGNADTVLWNLMLANGYLTFADLSPSSGSLYHLKLPNLEIKNSIEETFIEWLKASKSDLETGKYVHDLTKGDVKSFAEGMLYQLNTISFRDLVTENSYQIFVQTLLQSHLSSTHKLLSNKEAGHGYLDVGLIPGPSSGFDTGIILEFKHCKDEESFDLHKLARIAEQGLAQIEDKRYNAIFADPAKKHIEKILNLGIAFWKKSFVLALQTISERGAKASSITYYYPTNPSSFAISMINHESLFEEKSNSSALVFAPASSITTAMAGSKRRTADSAKPADSIGSAAVRRLTETGIIGLRKRVDTKAANGGAGKDLE